MLNLNHRMGAVRGWARKSALVFLLFAALQKIQ